MLLKRAHSPPFSGLLLNGSRTLGTPLLIRGCCKTMESLVGAVIEAMNQCEASNSPPDIGGVAAPSRKRCEATATAQTGWLGVPKCFGMPSLEEMVPFSTTPSAPLKEASRLL